jgi:hypothetical protein
VATDSCRRGTKSLEFHIETGNRNASFETNLRSALGPTCGIALSKFKF